LSGFSLEENVKRLIENTVIGKKGTSAYKNKKISAHDGLLVGSEYGDHLKQLGIGKEQ